MRKYIIGICVALILALTVYIGVQGVHIGKFEILGISSIKEQNKNLDETLKKSTKLASTDFQQKQDTLNSEVKELKKTKEEYEDTLATMTDNQIKSGIKIKNTIDFLFVRIENHAKSEGVSLKMEVSKKTKSDTGTVCDLNFTVSGTYTGVEEFITDLEDDSKLGFSIENFAMVASNTSGEQVEATFVCRDIIITGLEDSASTSSPTEKIDSSISTNTTDADTTNTNTNNTNTNNTVDANANTSNSNVTNN